MKRLKLITICAVVGCILAATGLATADIIPPWAEEYGTVYAAWDSWTGHSGPMPPDSWDSNPALTPSPYAYAYGASLKGYKLGRYGVLGMTANYQLEFYMPNFDNDNEIKKVWIQVTYYKGDEQYPLFYVNTEEEVKMTTPVLEGSIADLINPGWVTDAWSFQLTPNPAWEEIGLNFSSYGGGGGNTWVDQVVINTRCTTNPEPATIALLGLGALLLRRKR